MHALTLAQYQVASARTLAGRDTHAKLVAALGLCGEAGEVAELLKKAYGHGHELDKVALAKEIGDVLWYLAAIATLHNIDLEQAAKDNVEKLRRRYPDGFSHEASKARKDVTP
jgi:NTP pyrophosphatase (non-canonical NTP hydrolase)